MRALVQTVSRASVRVDDAAASDTGAPLLVVSQFTPPQGYGDLRRTPAVGGGA